MRILFAHERFTELNDILSVVKTKIGMELDIPATFLKLKCKKNEERKGYKVLKDKLNEKNIYMHSGVIQKCKDSDYIFKKEENEKIITIKLEKKCCDKIDYISGDTEVIIWLYSGKQLKQLKSATPILILEGGEEKICKFINISKNIPLGTQGLEEILFPNFKKNIIKGFERPKSGNVVPRLILIKGAPGTGKTILSVKLMISMVQNHCGVTYFSVNDSEAAIAKIAQDIVSEEQYTEFKENKERWEIVEDRITKIKRKYKKFYKYINKLKNRCKDSVLDLTKVIIVDSLNVTDYKNESNSLNVRKFLREWKLNKYTKFKDLLTFVIIEDPKNNTSGAIQQTISDCEFIADVVLELGEETRHGYLSHYIKVNKKHFGPQIYGKHLLKLLPKNNQFSNVENELGTVVYPSVHKYLSKALNDNFSRNDFVHTGVSHLDSMIKPTDSSSKVDGKSIPTNSCFVIQGTEGGYYLAIGMNILIGGLWKIEETVCKKGSENRPEGRIIAGDDVLLINLNEENNIEVFDNALSFRSHQFASKTIEKSLDNGCWIDWRYHNGTVAKNAFAEILIDETDGPVYVINENVVSKILNRNIDSDNIQKVIMGEYSELLKKEDIVINSSEKIIQILKINSQTTLSQSENSKKEVGMVDHYGNVVADDNELYSKRIGIFSSEKFEEKVVKVLLRTKYGDEHCNIDKNKMPQCKCKEMFEQNANENKKVVFNKWCAYILDEKGKRSGECRKMVVASFHPGCITSEQFIFCIQKLIEEGEFKRVLFNSTAHISMRFPLLEKDELFFPALVDLFKNKNVISVILDPVGKGSNDQLSYTLSNVADYILKLKYYESEKNDFDNINNLIALPEKEKMANLPNIPIKNQGEKVIDSLKRNADVCRWTELTFENIRGKNGYIRNSQRRFSLKTPLNAAFSQFHNVLNSHGI